MFESVKLFQVNIMCYKCKQKGFTLIEVLLAVIIVGFGITGLMLMMATGTQVNKFGNDLAASVFLADQIRSMTDEEPFDVLTQYNGLTFDGVDAMGDSIEGMNNYQQSISAVYVDPYSMNTYTGSNPQAVLLTASIAQSGKNITEVTWLRVK
ncbi:MAG: prepilin-type N-terminal cleavage/methylation domain-containing protein [Phycisphaerae bacterium]|nr:prepilin-type N-terminal cleavage/methylation domain-containing protein [Phycisphaerae bacterium]